MNYVKQLNDFLNDIKDTDSPVVEAIQKGFNLIFESTEQAVEKVKEKLPPSEEETWEGLLSEPEEEQPSEKSLEEQLTSLKEMG